MIKEDYNITVRKLTDNELLWEACETTFHGKSKISLLNIYKSEHSPARTQLFWVKFTNIPLFVATHFVRHHVGSVPYQLTCREDRKGGNSGFIENMNEAIDYLRDVQEREELPESIRSEIVAGALEEIRDTSDRNTPVNLGLLVNAQSLIDMAKVRLCLQAHKETVKIFKDLKKVVESVDKDLANMMVAKCVYRGGICGEPLCCGYNKTESFVKTLNSYLSNFSKKQSPISLSVNIDAKTK